MLFKKNNSNNCNRPGLFSSLLTCEVGGAKEVMWQRSVCNHGPGQLFQLGQVSQEAAEPRDSQAAVVVHQQRGETSQLADGRQQMSGVTGELHVTEAKLCQLMTERKQEVVALQGAGAAGDRQSLQMAETVQLSDVLFPPVVQPQVTEGGKPGGQLPQLFPST